MPFGAGVCRFSLCIEAAFVTDAYAVSVKASGVRPDFVQRTGTLYTAIPADVVMVTYAVEASFPVASFKVGLGKG